MLALFCFILFLPALGCVYIRDQIGRFLCHFYHSAIAGQLIIMVMRAVSGRLMMDFSLYTISILLYIPKRRDCCWFFFT